MSATKLVFEVVVVVEVVVAGKGLRVVGGGSRGGGADRGGCRR